MAKETKAQKTDRDEATQKLRERLPPGSVVYTTVRSVSRSGMSRRLDCYYMSDGEPMWITGLVARALGYSFDPKRMMRVDGCGMDMGFHVTHSLSYRLHGMATVGLKAEVADKAGRPFTPEASNYRAGYSLIHRWL